MSLASNERLEYIYDNNGKLLLISNNDRMRGDGSLVMRCEDPISFNRLCGPLVSATASPDDNAFTAEVGVSSELLSVSATLSRQFRHGAGPQDLRHPAIVLILRHQGEAALRVGGMMVPLDIAIVSSDVDFTIRAMDPDGVCSVSYIVLMGMPELVARMPRSLIVPKAVRNNTSETNRQDSGRSALRDFGEQVVNLVSSSRYLNEADMQRFAGQFANLIHEQFERGEWIEPSAANGCEVGMTTGNGRDIITMVQRYLRQHSSDSDVTPGRIARHCAVSVRKLYNAFAMADMSLRATVLSYRLEEARRQLNARMVKKVTSIAYDAGFRDVSTFYRNFRREFGYSPRNSVVGGLSQELATKECERHAEKPGRLSVNGSHEAASDAVKAMQSQDTANNTPLPRDTLFRHRTPQPMGVPAKLSERMRFPSS